MSAIKHYLPDEDEAEEPTREEMETEYLVLPIGRGEFAKAPALRCALCHELYPTNTDHECGETEYGWRVGCTHCGAKKPRGTGPDWFIKANHNCTGVRPPVSVEDRAAMDAMVRADLFGTVDEDEAVDATRDRRSRWLANDLDVRTYH